jgi:hypothetical protein
LKLLGFERRAGRVRSNGGSGLCFKDKVYNSLHPLYGTIGFNFQFIDCLFQFRRCFVVKFSYHYLLLFFFLTLFIRL